MVMEALKSMLIKALKSILKALMFMHIKNLKSMHINPLLHAPLTYRGQSHLGPCSLVLPAGDGQLVPDMQHPAQPTHLPEACWEIETRPDDIIFPSVQFQPMAAHCIL